MQRPRVFSHQEAARFYDMLGAGLDTQAFYETPVLRDLIAHPTLKTCRSVMEYGSGTGRLADRAGASQADAEFAFGEEAPDDDAERARALRQQVRNLARQGAMDPDDGMGL